MKIIKWFVFPIRMIAKPAKVVLTSVFMVVTLYLSVAFALTLWPPSLPFASVDLNTVHDQAPTPHIAVNTEKVPMRDGRNLSVARYPKKSNRTIVLVHGMAGSHQNFSALAPALQQATGAEILVPDLRGHGASDGAPFDVDYIGQYEHDLFDLMAHIRGTRSGQSILIAGHSMGGGIALRYALLEEHIQPDAYLLFAPNFGEGPTQRSAQATDESSAQTAPVYFFMRRMVGQMMLNTVGITLLNHLPVLYLNTPPRRKDYSFRGFMSGQPNRPQTSEVALAHIDVPMLVIVGSEDEVFDADAFEPFVSEHSTGTTVRIKGADHNSVLNDPATLRAVERWYAEVEASAKQ